MKKKVGDLTLTEMVEARRACHDNPCTKCILRTLNCAEVEGFKWVDLEKEVPNNE